MNIADNVMLRSAYSVLVTMLNTLYISSHIIFSRILWARAYHYSHFLIVEIELDKLCNLFKVIQLLNSGNMIEYRSFDSQAQTLNPLHEWSTSTYIN